MLIGNAKLMSHLPLAATDEGTCAHLRLTHPTDVDVRCIGANAVTGEEMDGVDLR